MPRHLSLLTALLITISIVAVQCAAPSTMVPTPLPTSPPNTEPRPSKTEASVLPETEDETNELWGTQGHPIRIAFVQGEDDNAVLSSVKDLDKLLKKETDLVFQSYVVSSYDEIIEAMCAGQAEIGWVTSFSYVLAHDRCQVEPKVITMRSGSEVDRSQISFNVENNPDLVVLAEDSGAADSDKIAALKGKIFTFTDPASTSGYLYPAAQFYTNGLDPSSDFGQAIYAGSDKAVILAIYRGDVDAGVSYIDARDSISDIFPDVKDRVGVLMITTQIANDVISMRADLPEDLKITISDALLKIADSEEGIAVLKNIYSIDGLTTAEDETLFNPVREIVRVVKIDPITGLPSMTP